MKLKKLISIMLIFFMLFSMVMPFTEVEAEEYIPDYDLEEYMKYYDAQMEFNVYDGKKLIIPDDNGNYCINKEGCHFELDISNYGGLEEGYYYYQLPVGVRVSESAGYEQDIYIGNSNYIKRRIYDDGMIELYVNYSITTPVNFTISEYIDFTIPSIKDEVEIDWENDEFDVTISALIPSKTRNIPPPKSVAPGYVYSNEWTIENTHGINIYNFYDGDPVDLINATVKMYYKGEEKILKPINQVTDEDEFSYYVWQSGPLSIDTFASNGSPGTIILLKRCECTSYEDCCDFYEDECWTESEGWCMCMNITENALYTIEYSFPQAEERTRKGSIDSIRYNNFARLNSYRGPSLRAQDYKELYINIDKYSDLQFYEENYMEEYQTIVNKSLFDFSGKEELILEEELSNLAYVPGTLFIGREDINGKFKWLQLNEDYEVEYVQGEDGQNKLNVKFKNPGKYTYYLRYYTQIAVLDENQKSVDTKNTSTLKFLYNPTKTIEYKFDNEYDWVLDDYKLTINKVDEADNTKKVAGAKFGLYSVNDGIKFAEGTTDENGQIVFQSDLEKNIVFVNGMEYYVQELEAPEAYYLDDTKHYFKYEIINSEGYNPDDDSSDKITYTRFNEKDANLTLTNKEVPPADLIINKADANNKKLMLMGGRFGLYRNQECTDLVGESTEEGNGVYSFKSLRTNRKYYLKDLKAPAGYALDPNTYVVSFENGKAVVTTLQSELYNKGDFTFYNAKSNDSQNNNSNEGGTGSGTPSIGGVGEAIPENPNNGGNSQNTGTNVENNKDKTSKLPYTGGKSAKTTYITLGTIAVVFAIFILKSQQNKKHRRTPRIGRK